MAGQKGGGQRRRHGRFQISTLFKLSSLRWTVSFSCFFSFPASWFTASRSSSISESVCLHHQRELALTDASYICNFSQNPNKKMRFSSVFINNKFVTCTCAHASCMKPFKHDIISEKSKLFFALNPSQVLLR